MQNVKKMVVRKANINNPFILGQRDWVSAGLHSRSVSRSQRMTASLGDNFLRSSHSLTKLVGALKNGRTQVSNKKTKL